MNTDIAESVRRGREDARKQAEYLSPFGWSPRASLISWANDLRWCANHSQCLDYRKDRSFITGIGVLAYIAEWGRIVKRLASSVTNKES